MVNKRVFFLIITGLIFSVTYADPPNWHQLTGTEYSMVLMAEVSLYGELFVESGNNIVAAFGPDSVNDCRSIATWQEPYPPFYNWYWYFTIVANKNGEEIRFKIYDQEADTIYNCGGSLTFADNATIGSPYDLYKIEVNQSSITGTVSLLTTTPPPGNINDVLITVGVVTTNPDDNGYYEISIDAGIYDLTASLDGYSDVSIKSIIVRESEITDCIDITLIDWMSVIDNQYRMVVMATASISKKIIEGNGCNQIAAFGIDAENDCRGVGVWQEANPPSWSGHWYFTIVGNTNREKILFRVYDVESDSIYECAQTVNFMDNTTIGTPADPFELSDEVSQQINLGEGWNWISFNVSPENTSIDSIFAQLEGVISQVKSQSQSAIYYDPPGVWVGDLIQIDNGKAYLINMKDPASSLTVYGMLIDPETPIELVQRWNWIAYYPQFSLPLESALNSIISNIYQIKNQNQSATYYGSWVGDLTNMEPGVGYKLKTNESGILVYPSSPPKLSKYRFSDKYSVSTGIPDWQQIPGTQYSMVLMAKITFNSKLFENVGSNMVGAFGPGGDEDCRGVANWEDANPKSWEGFWYFTIVGNDNGEEISFKIYDSETDSIYECNNTIIFEDNATIGCPTDTYMLISSSTGIGRSENILNELRLDQNFPNPFNPMTNIRFSLQDAGDVQINIYNIKGQQIRTLIDKKLNAGNHCVFWDGTDDIGNLVSSGIYFYKMSMDNYSETRKMILEK